MDICGRTVGTILSIAAVLVLALPGASAAQDGVSPTSSTVEDTASNETVATLNLARIKYRLAQAQAQDQSIEGLRLEYQLSVFGVAPAIEFLQGFDIEYGGVPFGAPTHADFVDRWTPREFRAPTVPLMPLIRWTFGR